jgi:hypothetical protein
MLKNLSISWENYLSSDALITMTVAAPNLESFTIFVGLQNGKPNLLSLCLENL